MPFKSLAQERFLYSQHPDIAKRWSTEHPKQNLQKLPYHVGSSGGTPMPSGLQKSSGAARFSPWSKMK